MIFQDVPHGWRRIHFGDIVKKMADGGTPSRTREEYFGGDVNWCVITDIKRYIEDTEERLTQLGLSNSSAKLWPERSIILSTGATIGKIGIAKVKTATKQGITGIVLDEDLIDVNFAYYLLSGMTNLLIRYSQGSTIKEVRPPILAKIPILLPPFPEQRKIASILTYLDDAIDKTNVIIEETKKMKNGLMQKLFTEGIGHSRFKETKIGRIPESWDVSKIKDVATVQSGFAFKSRDFLKEKSKYQVIRIGNLYSGKLDLNRVPVYLSEIDEEQSRFLLQEDDLIMTMTGTIGKRDYGFIVRITREKNLILNQRVGRIRLKKDKVNPTFIFYYCQTKNYLDRFFNSARGGTGNQTNIGVNDIRELKIILPPIGEQHQIAQILHEVDNKIEKEEATRDHLGQLKKGLMQVLLTGKVRVKA